MGKLLQFPIKAVPVAPPLPENPAERFQVLYSASIDHVRLLTALMRQTGKLDAQGERMMIEVVERLKALCHYVAGDSDGTT